MERTLATISVTTELIAHSLEVIARSQALFTSYRAPSYRISINVSLISMNFHKRGRSLAIFCWVTTAVAILAFSRRSDNTVSQAYTGCVPQSWQW